MHKLDKRPPPPPPLARGDAGVNRRALLQELAAWTKHHCSFCDDFLLGRQSQISHFIPRSLSSDHFIPRSLSSKSAEPVYDWDNLYLVCTRCNYSKGARSAEGTIRPDDPSYGFDLYFVVDPDSAELTPNPKASVDVQKAAHTTIELWRLNRDDLVAARKIEAMKYRDSKQVNAIDIFAFRDFLRQLPMVTSGLPSYAVESLEIENIKCFDTVEIPLCRTRPTSLLIGPNSRGKSTVLQLLAIGLRGLDRIPLSYAWRDVVRQGSSSGRFTLRLRYKGQTSTLPYRIDGDDLIHYEGDTELLERMRSEVLVLGYGVNRRLTSEESKPPSMMEPVGSLFGDNSYLKDPERRAQQYLVDQFDAIKPLVNAVFAQAGDGARISLDAYNPDDGYRFSSSSDPGAALSLQSLSEGFRSTFVWVLDLLMRLSGHGIDLGHTKDAAAIVLIDEVDLHLHPSWQRTLLPTLNELFPQMQFIVTTHSPLVAQALDPRDIVILTTSPAEERVTVQVKEGTASRSYDAIMRELFGVTSRFSIDVEKELKRFKDLKSALLRGEDTNENEFRDLVVSLNEKGPEVEGTVRRELMDLYRQSPGLKERVERPWNS